jgi:hypothetical protein
VTTIDRFDCISKYCNKIYRKFLHWYYYSIPEKAGPGNKPNSAQMELRLVQSKADIENPEILYKAVPL